MADLIAVANGNLTSSSTWAVVDSASKLDSEAGSTVLTTSDVGSSDFTPGAITIDGVAVKLLNRAASPTGTITCTLRNTTGGLDVATLAINVSDISADAITNNNGGWVFFYFGSTLLLAATNYEIRLKTSSNTQISAYRDGTAGNWSRLLRTTTTAAPAAADNMFIMGEWTAAATKTDRTVTMNETATTDYGKMEVCLGGTLDWGTTGSTNYYLKLSGNYNQYGGGTTQVGTTGTPIPSTSTAVIEFDCTTNVEFGMEIYGGTCTMQGASKTVKAMLAADAAASATALTTDVSTGWKNGDVIALAPTTRTASEAEHKSLTADASGTSLTISALTNAHGGNSTTKVQAELANLTRNVKVRGISTSNQSYVAIRKSATVDFGYAEFYNMGSGTSGKQGIDINSGTATNNGSGLTFTGCSFYDFIVSSSNGITIRATGGTIGSQVSIQSCVFYNIAQNHFSSTNNALPASFLLDNCVFIKNTSASVMVELTLASSITTLSITNNAISGVNSSPGSANGAFKIRAASTSGFTDTQVSGNVIHSNIGNGLLVSDGQVTIGRMKDFIIYRNSLIGLSSSGTNSGRIEFKNFTIFGNASAGINDTNTSSMVFVFYGCSIQGGQTLTQPIGLSTTASLSEWTFHDCNFGTSESHSSTDITPNTTNITRHTFVNCMLASATEITNLTLLKAGSFIRLQRKDNTSGSNITYIREGNIQLDSTIYDTTPSQRLTPNSNSTAIRLKSAPIRIPVASGQTLTPSVKVRTSEAGDGAAYNGNRARLVLEANGALGITSDTVIDTATAASDGAWETLTGTTATASEDGVMTFYVDCDGTAGFINVDTVTVA